MSQRVTQHVAVSTRFFRSSGGARYAPVRNMSRLAALSAPLLIAIGLALAPIAGRAEPGSIADDPAQSREAERGDALESEIQAELLRQEELMQRMEKDASATLPGAGGLSDESLAERADPRIAPRIPKDRDLPLAIFDREMEKIPAGAWGDNQRELRVVTRSLDADQDGKPEQIRYYAEETGALLRKEQDQNFDGDIDTWATYAGDQLVSRALDANDDGEADAWEEYAGERMTSRQVDRDQDGIRDAFYTYEGDSLVEEKHDADNDGAFDLVVTYRDQLRTKVIEDRNYDGSADSWTIYHEREEIVARIERDTDGSGRPDVFETYAILDGEPVLTKREEDKNQDGTIDITSIYENGKLVRREISDPSLMPL